jgi:hypothetical protein
LAVATLAIVSLSACSPGIPVAYHVVDDVVDIAFCESFTAASVEIDFGKYPPPLQGSLYSMELRTGSGPVSSFGDGVPASESMSTWAFDQNDPAPEGWERVDYSFFDENGEFVAGQYLFRDDVKSSDWAWQEGFNVISPQCDIDVD